LCVLTTYDHRSSSTTVYSVFINTATALRTRAFSSWECSGLIMLLRPISPLNRPHPGITWDGNKRNLLPDSTTGGTLINSWIWSDLLAGHFQWLWDINRAQRLNPPLWEDARHSKLCLQRAGHTTSCSRLRSYIVKERHWTAGHNSSKVAK